MHGRRSLNLELVPLDPDIDRTLRRTQKATVVSEISGEMGDWRENIPENVEQPIFENDDVRAGNGEQARAWHVDFTTSLRDLFTPVATSSHSCIVLPLILIWSRMSSNSYLLFMAWIMKTLMAMLRSLKTYVPHSNSRTFLRSLSTL